MSPDLSIHTTTTLLTPNTPSTDTRDTDTDTDTKKDKNVLTITLDNGQRYRQRHEKLLKQWKSETKRLFDRISSLPKLSEKCPIRRCKYKVPSVDVNIEKYKVPSAGSERTDSRSGSECSGDPEGATTTSVSLALLKISI